MCFLSGWFAHCLVLLSHWHYETRKKFDLEEILGQIMTVKFFWMIGKDRRKSSN